MQIYNISRHVFKLCFFCSHMYSFTGYILSYANISEQIEHYDCFSPSVVKKNYVFKIFS
jgi:hypothetical protein